MKKKKKRVTPSDNFKTKNQEYLVLLWFGLLLLYLGNVTFFIWLNSNQGIRACKTRVSKKKTKKGQKRTTKNSLYSQNVMMLIGFMAGIWLS